MFQTILCCAGQAYFSVIGWHLDPEDSRLHEARPKDISLRARARSAEGPYKACPSSMVSARLPGRPTSSHGGIPGPLGVQGNPLRIQVASRSLPSAATGRPWHFLSSPKSYGGSPAFQGQSWCSDWGARGTLLRLQSCAQIVFEHMIFALEFLIAHLDS